MWKILQTFDKISKTKGKSLRPQIGIEMLHFGGQYGLFLKGIIYCQFRLLNIVLQNFTKK